MTGQMYEVTIKASGEVRDKDGNLLNQTDVVFEKVTVTEEEAREIAAKAEALGVLEGEQE